MTTIAGKNRFKLMSNPNPYSRVVCSAFGCDMRSGTNNFSEIRMFTFPRNALRRRRWELATRRANWKSNTKSRICSKHFITGQPSKDPKHPDHVPSIFVFNKNPKDAKSDKSKKMKSKTSKKTQEAGESYGIKGFCSKCLSSESVNLVFNQSLEPIKQLMDKLKDMEEEREHLRNELALCREELYELHSTRLNCGESPPSTSRRSKQNNSLLLPSTKSVDVDDILHSMYSDEPADAYDPEVLPSQYLEQIYDQPNDMRKSKQPNKQETQSLLKRSSEVTSILDQSKSSKRQRVKNFLKGLDSKSTVESPKNVPSSDSSPITVIYLKR